MVNTGYDYASGQLRYAGTANPVASDSRALASTGSIVFARWEAHSRNRIPGTTEAGGGLYGVLGRYGLADKNNQRPPHFLAHRIGSVVNSEAIQRLGYFDTIQVDQMTTFDPRDRDEGWVPFEGRVRFPDVPMCSSAVVVVPLRGARSGRGCRFWVASLEKLQISPDR